MTKLRRLKDHPYYKMDWMRLPFNVRSDLREDALDWCEKTLRVGDRLTVARCGGPSTNFIFKGFDGKWIESASRSDIPPVCILKVNGEFVFPFGEDISDIEGYYK